MSRHKKVGLSFLWLILREVTKLSTRLRQQLQKLLKKSRKNWSLIPTCDRQLYEVNLLLTGSADGPKIKSLIKNIACGLEVK